MARLNANSADEEDITVCMRVRPLLKHERGQGKGLLCTEDDRIEMWGGAKKVQQQVFSCSHVFGPESSQAEVFKKSGVKSLLTASLHGFQSTLFGYGQTGSGKTHTILGETDGVADAEGIVPRAIRDLFQQIETLSSERVIKLRVSVLEIYREVIQDLLVKATSRVSLRCREHPKYGFFVDGLYLKPCRTLEEGLSLVTSALRNRHTATHLLNERSSRSHCLLTVHVDSLPRADDEGASGPQTPPTYGSMCFCDLAGSERPKATGSTGSTLKEAGHINKSLYTLGKVIKSMLSSKGQSRRGVPYRDSNLTKLLIGSLGGTSKAMMIGCVSPAAACVADSARTFDFANQVKGIKNRPVVQLDPREKLINDLRAEIERLRDENELLREQLAVDADNAVAAAAAAAAAQSMRPTPLSFPALPSSTSSSSSSASSSSSDAPLVHGPTASSPLLPSSAAAVASLGSTQSDYYDDELQHTRTAHAATLTDTSSTTTRFPRIGPAESEHDRGGNDNDYDDNDEEDERLERELEEQLANQLFDQLDLNGPFSSTESRGAPQQEEDTPAPQPTTLPPAPLERQPRDTFLHEPSVVPAPLPAALQMRVEARGDLALPSSSAQNLNGSFSGFAGRTPPNEVPVFRHGRPMGQSKVKKANPMGGVSGLYGSRRGSSRDAMKAEMESLVQGIRNRNRPSGFNF